MIGRIEMRVERLEGATRPARAGLCVIVLTSAADTPEQNAEKRKAALEAKERELGRKITPGDVSLWCAIHGVRSPRKRREAEEQGHLLEGAHNERN